MARCEYEGFAQLGFILSVTIFGNRVALTTLNLARRYRSTSTGSTQRIRFDCRRSSSWFVEAAKKGERFICGLRAYLRAGRRAGMRDSDRALRWVLLSDLGASRHEPEVARAQQVLQVPWFLPQHVFPGSAYLSLGIRVTS